MSWTLLSGAVYRHDDVIVVHLHPGDPIPAPWRPARLWHIGDLLGEWVERRGENGQLVARVRVLEDPEQPPLPASFVVQQLALAADFEARRQVSLEAAATTPNEPAPPAPVSERPVIDDARSRPLLALPARAVVVPTLVAVLAVLGLWLLPDLSPRGELPDLGYTEARAEILRTGLTDDTGQPAVEVRILDGPDSGTELLAAAQISLPGTSDGPELKAGDEVVVTQYGGPAGGFNAVGEVWRLPVLLVLLGAFALFVSFVGGWQGVRSLLALALTLLVVAKVVVPLLLRGFDPIVLAVGAAAVVTIATLTLTEGLRRTTLAASLGTIMALLVTAVIAALTTAAARFSAAQGSEEIIYLFPLLGDRLDLGALLLAATIFGALGVLDDVTVTQAAAVVALREADPGGPRRHLFGRAMQVGRAHIAATVNTLVLAYLGAGLPLLLLFAIGGQSPFLVANGELVAVEIVRSLAGSFGIVAAVPLTTAIAAFMLPATASAPNVSVGRL